MLMHFLAYILLISKSDCKILRNGNDFFADFNLVDANSRIRSNCVLNITHYTSEKECSAECVKEEHCESFNRHKQHGFCELLTISKFNESGLLERDIGWSHFETNDDEENIGVNCVQLKPCAHYEVCEDTLRTQPSYRCRCRDGFKGTLCQVYEGPGTNQTNPAASCRLLMLKHESIPDGKYWFKGKNVPMKCERKVDGRYTPWSVFGPCDKLCGRGTQRRNRTCSNPSPKGGGLSCEHLGPKEEVRSCFFSGSFFTDNPFNVSHNLEFATVDKLLMEYRIQLDFKVNIEQLDKSRIYFYNIFELHFRTDVNNFKFRGPSLYLSPRGNHFTVVHTAFEDGAPKQVYMDFEKGNDLFDGWVYYEISQKKVGSRYETKVELNGEKKTRVNDYPREIVDLKLYFSNWYNPSSKAEIKNFYYEGVCNLKQQYV